MTANTPDQIQLYRLLTLKSALKLEILGMKHSRLGSVAKIVRGILKSKTKNKQALLQELIDFIG